MTKFFDGYNIASEFVREIHEHEMLISFTDDGGAEAFQEWLANEGNAAFVRWLESQNSNNYYRDQLRHIKEAGN